MKCLEYVRNQIAKLKDDLQHYTMVEKDSALASQIRYDLEQFETIEKKLKALEIIKKYFWLKDFQDHITFDGRLPKSFKKEYDLLKEVLKWNTD